MKNIFTKFLTFAAVLLSAVLLFSIAAFADADKSNLTFTVSSSKVNVGDTVTVEVKNTAMTVESCTGGFYFDKDLFTVSSVTKKNDKISVVSTTAEANAAGTVGFALIGFENVKYEAGSLVKVQLTAKKTGTAVFTLYEDTSGEDAFANTSVKSVKTVISKKIDLSNAKVNGLKTVVYSGKEKTQQITVTLDGKTLAKGTDYSVSYKDNVNAGKATVTIKGIGAYSGSIQKQFTISPKQVDPEITLSHNSFRYNGKIKKPTVTVKVNGRKLNDSAYKVTYASGRKNVGSYKVTVKLTGNYSGKTSKTFKIAKADNSIKVTPASKTLKYGTLKNKALAFQLKATDKFGEKKTYALDSKTQAKAKKYISVSSSGKVTVKKETPKGSYSIKVRVKTKGTSNYNAKTITKTIKVVVK